MALPPFQPSRPLTLGVELELQIVNCGDYDLIARAPELLAASQGLDTPGEIKPEITASMIELATGICRDGDEVLEQLQALRTVLLATADRLDLGLCGGGTHPFQDWRTGQISDTPRFQHLSELYGYLAKQFTIFGQHVHIGCPGPDEALYLLHNLSRYIPHFIALSAASPYVQGVDTGFDSARLHSVSAFPLAGHAPFLPDWAAFESYYARMQHTGIVTSMKDFYWDIRPKPEFGTVEVRVMDTPLTLEHAAALAAYIQALARWLLVEQPHRPQEDDYLVYSFNRFQACRFGFDGTLVDPDSGERRCLADDILKTLAQIELHAIELGADAACARLQAQAASASNDAHRLRALHAHEPRFSELVRQQCQWWRGEADA